MDNDKIDEIIDLYFSKKKNVNNDYLLQLDEDIEIDVYNSSTNEISKHKTKEVSTRYDLISNPNEILKKENIENLSPDNIDIKHFWKSITDKFPNFSISSYPNCKNEDDVNKANLNAAIWNGFYYKIDSFIINKQKSKVLEIGPGYGNLFNNITKKHSQCDYSAIDVNPLFYYDGLVECDGKTIPEELGEGFDLVFSLNVFNHLSKAQRTSYYREVYNKLSKGGKFIFTNFLLSNHNEDKNELWAYKSEDDTPYNTFFSQLTPIDEYNALADELNDIGFSIKVKLSQNSAIIECEK